MYLSLNGHSKVPPGFRFHPTEEELLDYYLRKKVTSQKIDLDVIRDVELNKLEPWDIQACKIGSTPQNDWYFFSHKDKKYPTGTRTNRATAAGFWKATGRDKAIHTTTRRIGMRKTLVFYTGRAPKGLKSDWIMHEYRLDLDNNDHESTTYTNASGDSGSDEGWVVCRVFKKKNYQKSASTHSLINLSTTSNSIPSNDNGALDQMLVYTGQPSPSCKNENESNDTRLLSTLPSTPDIMQLPGLLISENGPSSDWAEVDRLVASQLNGDPFSVTDGDFSFCFDQHDDVDLMIDSDYRVIPRYDHLHDVPNSDNEHLWEFGRPSSSTSDPLCRLSV